MHWIGYVLYDHRGITTATSIPCVHLVKNLSITQTLKAY